MGRSTGPITRSSKQKQTQKSRSFSNLPKKSGKAQKSKEKSKQAKLCLTLVNEEGKYNMYVIPSSKVSEKERVWCRMLHVDGKNQTKRLEVTRIKIADLSQIRLNFMSNRPASTTAMQRMNFLQSLYKKEHRHLYGEVGKWESFIRQQPANVFVLRAFSTNPEK